MDRSKLYARPCKPRRDTLPTIDFTGKTLGEPIDIAAMDADRTLKETIIATAPEEPGIYAYRACIEGEGNKNKTCSTVITMTVGEQEPDLKITAIKAGQKGDLPYTMKTRLTVAPGAEFDILIGIKNEGKSTSQGAEVTFYRSTDDKISTTDAKMGTLDLKNEKLAPNKSLDPHRRGRVRAPKTPGTYYYGACVKSTVSVSDTNCSTPRHGHRPRALERFHITSGTQSRQLHLLRRGPTRLCKRAGTTPQ